MLLDTSPDFHFPETKVALFTTVLSLVKSAISFSIAGNECKRGEESGRFRCADAKTRTAVRQGIRQNTFSKGNFWPTEMFKSLKVYYVLYTLCKSAYLIIQMNVGPLKVAPRIVCKWTRQTPTSDISCRHFAAECFVWLSWTGQLRVAVSWKLSADVRFITALKPEGDHLARSSSATDWISPFRFSALRFDIVGCEETPSRRMSRGKTNSHFHIVFLKCSRYVRFHWRRRYRLPFQMIVSNRWNVLFPKFPGKRAAFSLNASVHLRQRATPSSPSRR